MLKFLSRSPNDHYSNICDIIEYIINVDWSSSKEQDIMVRSRMGASIAYEMALRARQRVAKRRRERAQDEIHQEQDASANSNE